MLATNYRRLDGHKVNPANDLIDVAVLDEPGAGGAHHHYAMQLPDGTLTEIRFQTGPIKESGVNGLTHEALLAILIDRMDSFQAGPYACEENEQARSALLAAQGWLKRRTEKRMERGVEGTHEK